MGRGAEPVGAGSGTGRRAARCRGGFCGIKKRRELLDALAFLQGLGAAGKQLRSGVCWRAGVPPEQGSWVTW